MIIIRLSSVLQDFEKNPGNFYLCSSVAALVWEIPGSRGFSMMDATEPLKKALVAAYPKVFQKKKNALSRRILDCWLNPKFLVKHSKEMGIEDSWFEIREFVQISEDFKFKCALLRYLIQTYGDCDIVVNVEE